MTDYFETAHYIFTHGWIPCTAIGINPYIKEYMPVKDWRSADAAAWNNARWINGMEAAYHGIIENGKTIVCGHWHCSFGHAHYEMDGGEFDNSPNFAPYYGKGIIALDACTPVSQKVNCIVIEDSIYGIIAGLKANMTVIAYLEHILYNKKEYISIQRTN